MKDLFLKYFPARYMTVRNGVLAAVACLVVVAGLLSLSLLDVDQYKAQIETALEDATGRVVRLDGPIEMALSLRPTVKATSVRFGNASWGSQPFMADAAELEIGFSIVNLFTGNIEVARVAARDVSLLLESHADGRVNWELTSGEDTTGDGDAAAEDISLPTLDITDARITYRSGRTGEVVYTRLSHATVANGLAGMWIEAEGRFDEEEISLSGRFNGSATDFSIDDLTLQLGRMALTGEAAAKRPKAGAPFDVSATISASRADLTSLVEMELEPDSDLASVRQSGFDFDAPLDLSLLDLVNGDLALSVGRLTVRGITLTAVDIAVDLQGRNARASLATNYLGRGVRAQAEIKDASVPGAKLVLDFDELDIGRLFAEADISDAVEARASGHVDVATTGRSPRALLAGLNGKVSGNVFFDELDLTSFAEGEGDEAEEDGEPGKLFAPDRLPLDMIDGFSGEVTIEAKEIAFRDATVRDLKIPLSFQGRKITSALTGTYRDQPVEFIHSADMTGIPFFTFDLRADDFNLGSLLKDLNVTDLVDVRADMAFHGETHGQTPRALASGFTGTFNLVTGSGEIASSAFELLAADIVWALVPKGSDGGTAKLTCFINRIDFNEGVGEVSAFALVTKRMRTGGKGTINLRDETLDLTFYPKPNDTSLLSLSAPVRVTGPLADPSVGLDTGSLLLDAVKIFGAGVFTGGIGAILPLMSVQNFDAEDAGACLSLLGGGNEGASGSGVNGAIDDGVGAVTKGVGAVTKGVGSVVKGVGDLLGGDSE